MKIRNDKEKVYQRIWYHHLPYTIIDVGYWYQISFPQVPSGRVDYAILKAANEIFGGGEALNLLVDKSDIGRFVARIIKDGRTLNQKIAAYSDVLSQNEVVAIMEKASGEKVELECVSDEELLKRLAEARTSVVADPTLVGFMQLTGNEYNVSKFLRKDNTPHNAKYLGYLDARELYPDFVAKSFVEFVDELLAGKMERPYPHLGRV